ncbi:reverse transcriptase domain-containing protein [Tanacetum coccineum]
MDDPSITMEEYIKLEAEKDRRRGKREHEEIEIFIKEFRTTNELLLKEQSNLLSKMKIKVNELSKIMGNVLIPENKVKGVTTRRGNMTSEAAPSKEINEIGINKNEPLKFERDVQEKLHDVDVKNKSSSISERTTQPLLKSKFDEDDHDNIMRRCVAGSEILKILAHCHSGPAGGHHGARITVNKVYESDFYWPSVFKDANEYVRRCDACQISGNISSRNEMPQNNIQELSEKKSTMLVKYPRSGILAR